MHPRNLTRICILLLASANAFAQTMESGLSQPHQQQIDIPIYSGAAGAAIPVPLPDGKRYLIEFVSAFATVPSGQRLRVSLATTVNGITANYYVPITSRETSSDTTDAIEGAQLTRVYADGVMTISVIRMNSAGPVSVSVSISGHLVDISQDSRLALPSAQTIRR